MGDEEIWELQEEGDQVSLKDSNGLYLSAKLSADKKVI